MGDMDGLGGQNTRACSTRLLPTRQADAEKFFPVTLWTTISCISSARGEKLDFWCPQGLNLYDPVPCSVMRVPGMAWAWQCLP